MILLLELLHFRRNSQSHAGGERITSINPDAKYEL